MKKIVIIPAVVILLLIGYLVFAEDGVELPVIMYHSVLKDGNMIGKYVVSPLELEQDLKYLRDNGYEAVTAADVIKYVYEGQKLPKKPVMITFDDGYYNNYLYAQPLLEQYDMKAVISVVGKYADIYSESDERNPSYSYLCWDDIKAMNETEVFEIQNHSYDMHEITGSTVGCKIKKWEDSESYRNRFCGDVLLMQEKLMENGVESTCFTYPYGMYCKESENLIKEMGFKMSLSCVEGVNSITRKPDCLYLLKRYNRPGNISSQEFFKKIK